MSDLDELRQTVLTLIQDQSSLVCSLEEVDTCLRMALLDYSAANPLGGAAVISLTADGRQVDVSALPRQCEIRRVYFPWDASKPFAEQEKNRVSGWETYTLSGSAALLFETQAGSPPRPGQQVRIHYTTYHTVAGLNGADQTSLPAQHLDLLARGAAGYALLCGAADRADLLDKALLERLASSLLESFRLMLAEIAKDVNRAGSAVLQWSGRYAAVY